VRRGHSGYHGQKLLPLRHVQKPPAFRQTELGERRSRHVESSLAQNVYDFSAMRMLLAFAFTLSSHCSSNNRSRRQF